MPGDFSVLVPLCNKARYLNHSIPSIQMVHGKSRRYDIICFDDGSRDTTVTVVNNLRLGIPRIWLFRNYLCQGTHAVRSSCVFATVTPWFIFLDPDDLMTGNGTIIALNVARTGVADIVQFGCMIGDTRDSTGGLVGTTMCWREPDQPRVLAGYRYFQALRRNKVDWHLHRKVFRTSLYRKVLMEMPDEIRYRRLYRGEDLLHYTWILSRMSKFYVFVKEVGEVWFDALPDNSAGNSYQTNVARHVECHLVLKLIRQRFHFRPRTTDC
jgi:glycosyltransferase involved in cell wall biosynthesis